MSAWFLDSELLTCSKNDHTILQCSHMTVNSANVHLSCVCYSINGQTIFE